MEDKWFDTDSVTTLVLLSPVHLYTSVCAREPPPILFLCPYHEPPDQIYRINFGEVVVSITKVHHGQTLDLVYSRMTLLYNCLGTVRGKKALLCVLQGYKPIRVRHFQAGGTPQLLSRNEQA